MRGSVGIWIELKSFTGRSVIGETRDAEMREQEFPTVIAPEDFEAEEGFISSDAPELSTALHSALHLAAGRFDGSRA